jgi:hypothetical protein
MTTRRVIECGVVMTLVAVAGGRLSARPPAETVHLEVVGGVWTGTYNAISTAGGCTAGKDGPGSWGNELYVSSLVALNALASLPLVVPDAKAAKDGTPAFYLAVGFGPPGKRTDTTYQLEVETRPNQKHNFGSGLVTVQDNGDTAIVAFTAQTTSGVAFKGTITCNTVTRKGGISSWTRGEPAHDVADGGTAR